MFNIYFVIDLVVIVALLGLGLTVYVKNRTMEVNRIFAYFVACISIWIISNYISNDTQYSPAVATRANYFVFGFSYLAAVFMLHFSIALAQDAGAKKYLRRLRIPIILIGLSSFTPLLVASTELQGRVYAVHFGPLLPIYFVAMLSLLGASIHVIRRNIRRTTGEMRERLRVLFNSLVLTLPLLVVMQFILPTAFGWFGLTNIGIFTMLIMVYGLYYGVVKHRLFDLRPVIVRSVTYVITLVCLTLGYGLVTYYSSTLISQAHSVVLANVFNFILIICVIAGYAPLRRAFNKVTNRIFYQDAYDAGVLYSEINKLLVSSIDLQFLLRHTAGLLAEHMKMTFVAIQVKDESTDTGYRVAGSDGSISNEIISREMVVAIAKRKDRMVITEGLESPHGVLKKQLFDKGIEGVACLTPNVRKLDETIGYIIVGTKKSGNSYNLRDAEVLSTIANELVIAIQNALRFEEIRHFNDTLQHNVDDATKKLRKTNEKLRVLDETKDEFITMASHQLRTPLTAVKGYLSMVLEGDAGKLKPGQRKLLEQSYASSQRMVYLIADLLNLSRLNTGKFVIESTPTNLAEVVEAEVEQLRETARSREVELHYTPPVGFPALMLDETKIHQVVMNFIDNAIYYTPAGGSIEVSLHETATSVEYLVQDTGIGVPRAEQRHLFSKFYRADNARRARPDGTGLGLFMAKKVVAAQGGAIIFHSEEGKGSTFGFRFSKRTHAVPTEQAVASLAQAA